MASASLGGTNTNNVSLHPAQDHKAIQNFKLLEVALEKAGIMQELNLPQLTKGQPQAHLELMQKLYALAPPDASAPAKGLRPLDANTLDSSGVRKGKAQAAAMNVRSAKRPAEEMANAEAADAEHDREAALSSATLSEMQSEIDRLQTELLLSQTESTQLRDEADFYIKKLGEWRMRGRYCKERHPWAIPTRAVNTCRPCPSMSSCSDIPWPGVCSHGYANLPGACAVCLFQS